MSTSIIPPQEPSKPTYQSDRKETRRDLEALARRLRDTVARPSNQTPLSGPPHPGIGTEYARWDHTHGAGLVFVQPEEPPDSGIGTLWFDTDAGV